MAETMGAIPGFTGYQKFVVAVLVFLQFTIILDFMIMAPQAFSPRVSRTVSIVRSCCSSFIPDSSSAQFRLIVGLSAIAGVLIFAYLKPIDSHLRMQNDRSPRYLMAFCATALLSIGGFMLMTFGSAFTVHNLMIPVANLTLIYGITGVRSSIIVPLIGRAADRFGKFPVFVFGSVVIVVNAFMSVSSSLQQIAGGFAYSF